VISINMFTCFILLLKVIEILLVYTFNFGIKLCPKLPKFLTGQTMEVWPSKLQEKEQNGSSLHLTKYTEINCSKGLVTSTTTQTRRHIDLRHGISHQNPLVPLGLLCLLGFQDLGVGIGTSF